MSDKPLPQFKSRSLTTVKTMMSHLLNNQGETTLVDVVAYSDGHYRAIFRKNYFVVAEGAVEPSKSQWNTFKKKIKRHDPRLFIFKEHGTERRDGTEYYYIDFGFFAE